MKKIISQLLLIVVLFNFICCNRVYADDAFNGDISSSAISTEQVIDFVGKGVTSLGKITWSVLGPIFGTIAGILAAVLNLFPAVVQIAMYIASGSTSIFTIEQAVFNEIGTFNIDYFDFNSEYTVGNTNPKTVSLGSASIILSLRNSVAKFFVLLRLIASALSLLILIYVGIRMAFSTLSSDKAKYKKMLIGWLESVIILFMMQYIISFTINLGEMFENLFYDMRETLNSSGSVSFEDDILDKITTFMIGNSGWTYTMYSIVYWFLVFIQTKFFLSYYKRLITVGFLILIAPLVTITYPIDKIGDGKAQAFTVWYMEFAMNVFIQPIQALIYLVFMFTAGEIAQYSILVALIFLLSLTKVEKTILHLFNLRNVASLKPVDDERKKGK